MLFTEYVPGSRNVTFDIEKVLKGPVGKDKHERIHFPLKAELITSLRKSTSQLIHSGE